MQEERLKMHTANKVDKNIELIGKLFPNTLTETIKGKDINGKPIVEKAIDFDILRQELSDVLVEGPAERYQMNWPDKRKAIMLANQATDKTLRPCREESVDFDNTENLYIEGDNLEVLKLLQETYLNRIKMIYIDPPYNTGNDSFVYDDDFKMGTDEFSEASEQYDEDGNMMFNLRANSESNGRFHTDWLNMMYPRLKLAKDLLAEDGVIFISIDDNEQGNLKNICDEIFGEVNFITCFIWAAGKKNDSKYVSVSHEYILCYVKSLETLKSNKIQWREQKEGLEDIYNIYTELKRKYEDNYTAIQSELKRWYKNLAPNHPAKNHAHYSSVDRRGIYFPDNISWPGGGGPRYEVIHPKTGKPVKIPSRGWLYSSPDKMNQLILDDRVQFGEDETSVPCIKSYLKDRELATPYSVFYKDGRASTKRLRNLMGTDVFQNPKDEEIIQRLIEFALSDTDSVILDFFSGSATTAHAVLLQNLKDGGNRKFILVQIPEKASEKSNAYKAGYKTICEIGKERIRRAGQKIKEENPDKAKDLDTGFRVLKLDSSNMKDVYYTPDEYSQATLGMFEDNIKEDRSAEDLLFQVMLELDEFLSSDIKEMMIAGKKVFNVANGNIIACFDTGITEDVVIEIAKMQPYYAVFRDNCMASDSVATNFEQIFKTYSPSTVRKVL